MSWVYLFLAIISEVTGTTCMKLSVGFTKVWPSIAIFIFYGISLTSFTIAIKKIDISVAYAVWSGLGISLISTIGILWFEEPVNFLKIASIGIIIIGVIGLNINRFWTKNVEHKGVFFVKLDSYFYCSYATFDTK